MTNEIEERTKLLLADGWTQMGDWFYKDDLIIKKKPCNCISCHRFPQWIQNEIGKNIQAYLDKQIYEKQLRDAGLRAKSEIEQDRDQWKGIALAMSKLIQDANAEV